MTTNELLTPLHLAAQLGSDFFIEEVIKAAPQLLGRQEKNGRTALFYAVQHDVVDLVDPLLSEAGKADNYGVTALRIALQIDSRELAQRLAAIEGELVNLEEEDISKLV